MDNKASDISPEIIYEDSQVIVAVKPAGVLSQADTTGAPDMLTILKGYIKEKYGKPGNVYLGLVHRLDRPVEGIMVFARTSKAASRLSEQIRERKVTKKYRAVVHGTKLRDEGTLEDLLLKDPGSNVVRIVDMNIGGAKRSVLDYKVIGRKEDMSLLEIKLGTGRSHQIRVQLAGCRSPIVGDRKYGYNDHVRDIALQSYVIGFEHPTKGGYMEFSIPLGDRYPWSVFKEE